MRMRGKGTMRGRAFMVLMAAFVCLGGMATASARAAEPVKIAEGVLDGSPWTFSIYRKNNFRCLNAVSAASTLETCQVAARSLWSSGAELPVGPRRKAGAALFFYLAPGV